MVFTDKQPVAYVVGTVQYNTHDLISVIEIFKTEMLKLTLLELYFTVAMIIKKYFGHC